MRYYIRIDKPFVYFKNKSEFILNAGTYYLEDRFWVKHQFRNITNKLFDVAGSAWRTNNNGSVTFLVNRRAVKTIPADKVSPTMTFAALAAKELSL